MALTMQQIEEQLHTAYVSAVVAQAGATFDPPRFDIGVDGWVARAKTLSNGELQPSGIMFGCQLKASSRCALRDDSVVYDMKVEAYNKLARWEGTTPCFLILFRLPRDCSEWIHLTEEHLLLRNCCYWYHISGPESKNRSSQRVVIPREQKFTPDAVLTLLDRAHEGEFENEYAGDAL